MMTAFYDRNSTYFIYGIPLLVVAISVAIGFSPFLAEHPELTIGITYDLTLSAPIIYLLLIRKTDIPKITVIPFFTGGVMIASFILPGEMQFHLGLVKFWLLPVVEFAVVGYVGLAAYKTVGVYRSVKTKDPDVLTVLRLTCEEVYDQFFSKTVVVNRVLIAKGKEPLTFRWYTNALALEIGVFYYGFLSWRGFKPRKDVFSYHKKNGIRILYGAILFIIAAETIVFHVLLEQWSAIAAWIVTIPSVYLLIQIFAHIKAMSQRPIEINNGQIIVRSGLLGETTIDITKVESVVLSAVIPNDVERVARVGFLKDLEQFNTVIKLKEDETFYGFYGIKSRYQTLLLYVDENAEFKRRIEEHESD